MGCAWLPRNKRRNIRVASLALQVGKDQGGEARPKSEKISTGPNKEPINKTIAGTGPGIPDDALSPGKELPKPPTDEEIDRIPEKLGAPTTDRDTLPLEGE